MARFVVFTNHNRNMRSTSNQPIQTSFFFTGVLFLKLDSCIAVWCMTILDDRRRHGLLNNTHHSNILSTA